MSPAAEELSAAEQRRYARHLSLPEIGAAGQARLRRARVLLVGVGGLGSASSLYLTAAGVGRLGLAECDTVDDSNLQRQVLYETSQVGRPKLDAARQRLLGLNPQLTLDVYPERVTAARAPALIGDYDLVVDGTDNYATRYALNDACVRLGKPFVYGSVREFQGEVTVFATPAGPCYRCLHPAPPPPVAGPPPGLLGVVPGVIGVLQATAALQWLLGLGSPLVGRLLRYDARAMSFRLLRLARDRACPGCGQPPRPLA